MITPYRGLCGISVSKCLYSVNLTSTFFNVFVITGRNCDCSINLISALSCNVFYIAVANSDCILSMLVIMLFLEFFLLKVRNLFSCYSLAALSHNVIW